MIYDMWYIVVHIYIYSIYHNPLLIYLSTLLINQLRKVGGTTL
jgi:hypothetical protein